VTSLDLLADRLRRHPPTTVLACDFDGTLSAIVDDPAAAGPVPGALEVLADLATTYGTVAVISGRPVAFLQALLPPSVQLHGLYGLERVVAGARSDHEAAAAWRVGVDAVVAASRAWAPEGVGVEPKGGLSITLHYRTRPELADDVHRFAEAQAAASGLALRPARMSVELHPPVAVDKGTVLRSLAAGAGAGAACFIGDDAGDLPAFTALDDLAAEGTAAVRIAVRSAESPPALLERADGAVDGPLGVVAFLRSLLD
jgi:trehalose 6-phosphate phosphatase